MDDSVFPFLSLPAELRDEIYHYSVGDYGEIAAVLYHANEKMQKLVKDMIQSDKTDLIARLVALHKVMLNSAATSLQLPTSSSSTSRSPPQALAVFEEAGSHHRRQRGTGLLPDGRRRASASTLLCKKGLVLK